jgi:hypothetical protein
MGEDGVGGLPLLPPAPDAPRAPGRRRWRMAGRGVRGGAACATCRGGCGRGLANGKWARGAEGGGGGAARAGWLVGLGLRIQSGRTSSPV